MQLYKLARKILPLSFQAKLGNRHKVKRTTLDPLLFKFTHHPNEERLLYEKSPTRNVPVSVLEGNPFIHPAIAASYRQWYQAEQIQQIIHVRGDVIIEPKTGWPMGLRNELYLSLHPSGATPFMPIPSYKTIFNKKPMIHLNKVISLRNANEVGYSHFYTDLLAKLALVRSMGHNLKDYTVVISKRIAQTPYAEFLLNTMPLAKEIGQLYLQDQEFIQCEEALFVNVFGNSTHSPAFMDVLQDIQTIHPFQSPSDRKVFLTRGKNRRRTLQNGHEISEILAAKGFESVDTDLLSLPEQIKLFAECRHLVGIHGAGLVNMLYRYPKKLSLFEICEPMMNPKHGLNAQYHNMAVALGFDYGATFGDIADVNDHHFFMPPDRFEKDFNKFWAVHGDTTALRSAS